VRNDDIPKDSRCRNIRVKKICQSSYCENFIRWYILVYLMSSKATSPAIGTLLMILVVLGIGAVIYCFGTSFVKEGLGKVNTLPREGSPGDEKNSYQEENSISPDNKDESHHTFNFLIQYRILTAFAVSTTAFFIIVLKFLIGKTPPPRKKAE
jgi:hypothetical protein